jgi:phosphotransferase system enzyme I (PtsI)
MISCIDELREAKDLIKKVEDQLFSEKIDYGKNIEIGIMIEVPSTAIMIEHYIYEGDFFSIGTNDLIQYTVAVDRTNEKVAYLYDEFNPAVVSLIKNVATISRVHNKFVGILLLNTILKCKNGLEIKLNLENFIKDNKIIL